MRTAFLAVPIPRAAKECGKDGKEERGKEGGGGGSGKLRTRHEAASKQKDKRGNRTEER